jgi:RHS repeat-associated protein
MTGISSKALLGAVPNHFKFNDGTELEKKEFIDGSGLELYMTDFRNYDPQLGRFQTIDILAEWALDISPYVFAYNNPILFNDPLGLVSDTAQRGFVNTATDCEVLPEVVVVGTKKPSQTQSFLNTPLYLNNLPNTENFNPDGYRPLSTPKEIGLEKAPRGLPIVQFGAAAGMTIVFTLLPLSAGPKNMPGGDEMYYLRRTSYFDPFPRPKPPFTNDNSSIILYRGVHAKHDDIANARKGVAVPWGGHSSVIDHNLGNNQSIFTSWTVYKNVAAKMAGRRGWGGVILSKRFKRSEVQLSFDKFMQGEVLVPGVVTGAYVQYARPSN